MRTMKIITLALMLVSGAVLGQTDNDVNERDRPADQVVALEGLPAHVKAAIKAAKPNAFVTKVERQLRRDDTLYYRVNASEVDRFWVMLIRDDGELMELYEQPVPPS